MDQGDEEEGSNYQDIANLTEDETVDHILDVSSRVLENGIAGLQTSSPLSTENETEPQPRPQRTTRNTEAVYNFTRPYEKKP